jgi:hypothetical protein
VYAWQDPHGRAARLLEDAEEARAALQAPLAPAAASADGAAPESISSATTPPGVAWRFDGPDFAGWRASGGAFGSRPVRAGELLAPDGSAPARALVGSASSRALSAKARGALRSPTFVVESGDLWLRVRGHGAHARAHVDGYFLDEENNLLFESHKQDLDHPDEWRTRHVDLSRYVGEECWLELVDPGDGWLEVAWVATGELADEWKAAAPALERPLALDEATRLALDEPLSRLARLARDLPEQPVVLACEEGSGRDAPLYARGRPASAKASVPRGAPESMGTLRRDYAAEVLAASSAPAAAARASDSGRLELARELVDPAHPLTWRVAANRVWHHVMGSGLVATTDDFGVLGTPPTHPELLDWLACRLREHRSLKQLAKELVLSRTFAQRGAVDDAEALERDPRGARLSRRPARRLPAESVRDSLLAASGRLVEREGGPPVAARLTDFMQGRGRPGASGPEDGAGARSLHLEVRRNFLDPFLAAFDQPIPNSPRGARNVSNVPAQGLALMNDPMVRDLAASFARWILAQEGDAEARAAAAIRRLWSRPARTDELALAKEFLGAAPDFEAWHDWAHALFLAQETIYLP